jgi:ATP/maltotriose-dependent transcriptional regulator MalT
MFKAWALLIRAQFVDAERCARDAETAPGLSARMQGHINAIQSTVAINLGDSTRAIALAHQALDNLPPDEVLLKGMIALNLGDSYASINNLPAAQKAFSEAIAINKHDGNIFITLASMGGLGALHANQGDLYQAARIYRQAIQQGTERGKRGIPVPMTGTAYTLLVWPLYHWNDLDAALDFAIKRVECCTRWGHFRSLTNSYRILAYVQQACGEAAAAWDALGTARHIVETKMAVAWPVHCKAVGDGILALKYLAPYIFRVAISNNRIIKMTDTHISFRYRSTKTGKTKICTVSAEEFIRRFLQHVLPKGFVKVRYYGFFSSGLHTRLAALRAKLNRL